MSAKPGTPAHLDCPICKEALTDPRITDCGHTFCRSCLQNHVLYSGARSQDRKCPICNKRLKIPKGGVQELPVNYLAVQAKSAADEVDEIPTNTRCGACGASTTGGVFCRTCHDYLCHRCGNKHLEVFTSHGLTDNLDNIPTEKCNIHHGKTINCFCSHCMAAVCSLCATCSHSEAPHRVIPLEEARNERVELLKGKLLTLKDMKKKLSGDQDTLDGLRQTAVDNYALQKGMVDSTADDAVRRIRAQQKEVQRRIQSLHDNNITMLDQHDRVMEKKCSLLDAALIQIEAAIESMNISDFHYKCHEVEAKLKEIDYLSCSADSGFVIQDYTFTRDGNCIELGDITLRGRGSVTDIDLLKSHEYNVEGDDNRVEEVVERRRRPEQPEPLPVPVVMKDDTERKAYIVGSPALLSSYVMGSGVDSIPVTMIGLGLMPNDDVVYAYNTNNMGQVVVCSSVDKQQVVYHRRKGIAAFAMYREYECGVVLEDDCNVSRLFLKDVPSERDAPYTAHKISCRAANIGALAFHLDGVMVLFDKDKTCLTGIDRQSKRPFNLQGNRNEDSGCFSTVTDLTSGPQGEIILYDGEKRRLVVFSSDTKFLNYIDLSSLSSSCSIDCDDYGTLFIADRKQGKVVRCGISGQEDIVEVLNAAHGITSPCCLCVSQTKLAVGNVKSFSEGEIRVFELGVPLSTG